MMETNCQGHMPDRICLLKSLLNCDGRANGLIFGKKATNTTCGAKAQKTREIPPGLFNVALLSHTVIALAYH